ncbi:LysM peptidoglycan-binding domain-containing protein [Flavobacterium agrisoli]|uniref:LysM peptidoglycan-binding domain-containing protein n=1 Tax=Flavobacterium agrisoli TaxID=2793066 RepID=A0A934UIX2_9FLAO|nr:LysM peptidoglycan-binding domain-containing protein [Flavobacterium agrisoli]MBK0369302.1 LysM peptidoglycan-binding domain-containing protein [Flavobacterium agrisoli]
MSLQDKYAELIATGNTLGIANWQVREQDQVLYLDGTAKSTADKDKLWEVYGKLDPDFRSADVVMNIAIAEGAVREYTVVSGDSLSKIGKAHGVSWQKIYEANTDIIKNPDIIQPGWKLKIPTA